jgi:hypothetical protein
MEALHQIRGPVRQLRLRYDEQMDLACYVTDVQYPVEKQV